MHAICHTSVFTRAASDSGMTDDEVDDLEDLLARNPVAGEEMVGTGGCRKLRLGGKGKGKSGGFRVVTFFTGDDLPVFLITVFAKGDRANLTKGERNMLAKLTGVLVYEYRKKVVAAGERS
ncbi:MAG: type II toxin-antitoxin system RelE/ParE family toxin [Beijerinckiaceae bacterium]|nr:type II toxin-antitoxin system RelE/ParE family toxin [Beijerinckiaceae bacterium]